MPIKFPGARTFPVASSTSLPVGPISIVPRTVLVVPILGAMTSRSATRLTPPRWCLTISSAIFLPISFATGLIIPFQFRLPIRNRRIPIAPPKFLSLARILVGNRTILVRIRMVPIRTSVDFLVEIKWITAHRTWPFRRIIPLGSVLQLPLLILLR